MFRVPLCAVSQLRQLSRLLPAPAQRLGGCVVPTAGRALSTSAPPRESPNDPSIYIDSSQYPVASPTSSSSCPQCVPVCRWYCCAQCTAPAGVWLCAVSAAPPRRAPPSTRRCLLCCTPLHPAFRLVWAALRPTRLCAVCEPLTAAASCPGLRPPAPCLPHSGTAAPGGCVAPCDAAFCAPLNAGAAVCGGGQWGGEHCVHWHSLRFRWAPSTQ